ncbi:MAG: class I SAM-dependent methyltransferase [Candidatus Sumerlaeia bacterium]|nr:class I SAM-dependent methyltransferase [Candidatus Sumerlaeia bacterium]
MPDAAIRFGIRALLCQRLAEWEGLSPEARGAHVEHFVRTLRQSPVAVHTRDANEQHYEVPPEFFGLVLGKHRKYSGCLFPPGVRDLDTAEARMLETTCRRARLRDGQRILELGCGWGSLTLWMAEHFPNSRILAVSNSAPQRRHIEQQLAARGLRNVEVRTCDMNAFDPGATFDRVVSVEMFEHMRNIPELFRRVAEWLDPDGLAFLHVFAHREYPYYFETDGDDNWMGRYFFTGGMMPSDALYYRFPEHLTVCRHWVVGGRHYARTADAWLRNLDTNRARVLPILSATYGAAEAERWFHRWRIFFLACAELWGMERGRQWWVSHYLLKPTQRLRQSSEVLRNGTTRALGTR